MGDGDGFLSMTELKTFLDRHPDMVEGNDGDLAAVFKELDGDNSGQISINEFVAATLDAQGLIMYDVLWDAFKSLDANKDGAVKKNELVRMVQEVRGHLPT